VAEASKPQQSRYWTTEEHERFLEALKLYGNKDVKAISNHVGSRNTTQVRSHAQKYFQKMDKGHRRQPSDEESVRVKLEDISIPGPEGTKLSPDSQFMEQQEGKRGPPEPAHMRQETFIPPPSQGATFNHQDLRDVSGLVLGLMNDWTPADYHSFVEGMIYFADEHNVNTKCTMISQKFLPKHPPDRIKVCYTIVHSALNGDSSKIGSKRMRPGSQSPMAGRQDGMRVGQWSDNRPRPTSTSLMDSMRPDQWLDQFDVFPEEPRMPNPSPYLARSLPPMPQQEAQMPYNPFHEQAPHSDGPSRRASFPLDLRSFSRLELPSEMEMLESWPYPPGQYQPPS